MAQSNVNADVMSELSKSGVAELMAAGMIAQPKQKRKRVDWERLLVDEYVQTHYLDIPNWFQKKLDLCRQDLIQCFTRKQDGGQMQLYIFQIRRCLSKAR